MDNQLLLVIIIIIVVVVIFLLFAQNNQNNQVNNGFRLRRFRERGNYQPPRPNNNYFSQMDGNCVKFEECDLGVEGITKHVVVNGTTISVKLFNWVLKSDSTSYGCEGEYFQVDFDITNGQTTTNSVYKAGIRRLGIAPGLTSGTVKVPRRDINSRALNIQQSFSFLIFCLEPVDCEPASIVNLTKNDTEASIFMNVTTSGTLPINIVWTTVGADTIPNQTGNSFSVIKQDGAGNPVINTGVYQTTVTVSNQCGTDSITIRWEVHV